MVYADFAYYQSADGFCGTKLTETQFNEYRVKAQSFVDMITFHRIEEVGMTEEEIPVYVKNTVCALSEYMKRFDDDGGAIKASETISKQSVSYFREQGSSKESEMLKVAMSYLDGTWLAYRGV